MQDSDRWKNEKCYLLFYPDGTFIPVEYLSNLSDLKNNIHHKRGHRFKSKKERWCMDAGVYRVYGDTIEVNRYYDDFIFLCNRWREMEKLKFKIIDSTTICRIYVLLYDALTPSHSMSDEKPLFFHFVPAKNIPQPQTRLKREKWLWEHPRLKDGN